MSRVRRVGAMSVFASVLLVASFAVPTTAAGVKFGAKLTHSTQAQGAETCHSQSPGHVPSGGACTWVARTAFENGSNYKAPATGTLHKLRLVTCDGGSFTLQIVKLNSSGHAKLVRNGPHINYPADPQNAGGNCGGEDGDEYIVQAFNIHVAVERGDYIAIKSAKVGMLHCSGSGIDLYYPGLGANQAYRSRTGGVGCDLLVSLQY